MTLRRASPSVPALALLVIVQGCTGRWAPPGPRAISGESIVVEGTGELDLLLVIDDSASMMEEQALTRSELPRLVGILASGDRDGDGARDFPPVDSLHVGVVTSNMGSGGTWLVGCEGGRFGNMFGDDGVLVTRGHGEVPGCLATYPPVLEFVGGESDPDAYARDVACVAMMGTDGCDWEQPLEATLKALSPSSPQAWTAPRYEPPIFFGETRGHADGANAGLVRPGSALAIVLVTDEDDCSVSDPEILDPWTTEYPGELALRCWTYEEAIHPLERYVRGEDGRGGLAGLRRDPARLVFAGIVGVPLDAVGDDYAGILAHPDMQNELEATGIGPRLRPSCDTANGLASPPRRIVQVAQGLEALGARTTMQSICQASYAGVIDAIVERIADALGPSCRRGLAVDAEGLVDCALLEVLPADAAVTCDELAGRAYGGFAIVAGEPRTVCEVTQVGPEGASTSEPGWMYEGASSSPEIEAVCGADGGQVALTVEAFPDAACHLECPAR